MYRGKNRRLSPINNAEREICSSAFDQRPSLAAGWNGAHRLCVYPFEQCVILRMKRDQDGHKWALPVFCGGSDEKWARAGVWEAFLCTRKRRHLNAACGTNFRQQWTDWMLSDRSLFVLELWDGVFLMGAVLMVRFSFRDEFSVGVY